MRVRAVAVRQELTASSPSPEPWYWKGSPPQPSAQVCPVAQACVPSLPISNENEADLDSNLQTTLSPSAVTVDRGRIGCFVLVSVCTVGRGTPLRFAIDWVVPHVWFRFGRAPPDEERLTTSPALALVPAASSPLSRDLIAVEYRLRALPLSYRLELHTLGKLRAPGSQMKSEAWQLSLLPLTAVGFISSAISSVARSVSGIRKMTSLAAPNY